MSGCIDSLPIVGGGGPGGAAENFIQAANQGNAEEVRSLVHPESPVRGEITGSGLGMMEEADVSVEGTEVVEQNDDSAIVEVTASVRGETGSLQLEMRKDGDQWKVWDMA
ncbi:DUF4878 domain-containing protein [Salinirussus salinus]|jgi:hypothetical protein|uniref:DUF4878 domain-containing protein n=1 Tax=Salinirussus salinus TaxID=1198300 RepID=UPI00135BD23D|nr:DUF4878 domain-containing protein [Salinirussus salinus]